ncbi:MAG: HD domain-containing protein [Bacillota bacterium]
MAATGSASIAGDAGADGRGGRGVVAGAADAEIRGAADGAGLGSEARSGGAVGAEGALSTDALGGGVVELCMRILRRYALPDGVIEHSVKVAEVARFIAARLVERGEDVNLERVVAGALLHDVGKSPRHVRRGARNHAEASAEIVQAEGLPELAGIVARHILDSIISEEDYPRNWEEKVVFYADKIVTRRLVRVEDRFADLHERRADITDLLTASLPPTKALEAEIFAAAGLAWDDLASRFGGKWVVDRRS